MVGTPLPQFSSALTSDSCSSSSGSDVVAMMQPAEPWHRYDLIVAAGILLRFTTHWRSLVQSKMSPVLVIITNVSGHKAFQMPLIEHDHIVEQIPAAVANPALGDTVLPRASETCLLYTSPSPRTGR